MAPLEQRLGFRVVAVAPGLVNTPLWTTEKGGPIGADVAWVTPAEVAQVMLDIIEQYSTLDFIAGRPTPITCERINITGGTILEVSGSKVREVKQYNDPGPQGIDEKDFDSAAMEKKVFKTILADARYSKL